VCISSLNKKTYCILHIYIVIHFCYSTTCMWSSWMEVNLCRFCYLFFLYMCWRWSSNYQKKRVGINKKKRFNPATFFCACPKQRTGFPTSYVVTWSELRWLFVLLIGGIVDPHFLKLSFHNLLCSMSWDESWLFILLILYV